MNSKYIYGRVTAIKSIINIKTHDKLFFVEVIKTTESQIEIEKATIDGKVLIRGKLQNLKVDEEYTFQGTFIDGFFKTPRYLVDKIDEKNLSENKIENIDESNKSLKKLKSRFGGIKNKEVKSDTNAIKSEYQMRNSLGDFKGISKTDGISKRSGFENQNGDFDK